MIQMLKGMLRESIISCDEKYSNSFNVMTVYREIEIRERIVTKFAKFCNMGA